MPYYSLAFSFDFFDFSFKTLIFSNLSSLLNKINILIINPNTPNITHANINLIQELICSTNPIPNANTTKITTDTTFFYIAG